MGYSIGHPAYAWTVDDTTIWISFIKTSRSELDNPNSVYNMLKNLPDLSKSSKLEKDIAKFTAWQNDPKFPERKKK